MVAPDVLARGDWSEICAPSGPRSRRSPRPASSCRCTRRTSAAARSRARARRARHRRRGRRQDRLDVALAAGAHGVHLPENGLSIEAARALAASRVSAGFSMAPRAARSRPPRPRRGPAPISSSSARSRIPRQGPRALAPPRWPPPAPGSAAAPASSRPRRHRRRGPRAAGPLPRAGAVAAIRAAWAGQLPPAMLAGA